MKFIAAWEKRKRLPPCQDLAKLYRAPNLQDVELFYARYVSHTFTRHTHDTFAIGVVDNGVGAYDCENRRYVVRTDDLILINPGDLHTGGVADTTGVAYRMCYIPAARMHQVQIGCQEKSHPLVYFSQRAASHRSLGRLIRSMHTALDGAISVLEQESRLLCTLNELITTYCGTSVSAPTKKVCSRAVRQACAILEDRYAEPVTLMELSKVSQLSPYHLLRMFRDSVGLPPHCYQNQIRIAKAKALLARNTPIVRVAVETGFVDQSHFTKVFKRFVGVTPGQYASAFAR
jgi:AraC-like DNA-binding protein